MLNDQKGDLKMVVQLDVVIGGGPAICVVGKGGCEEVLCRVVVLRCGSGESGRMVAGGVEGT